MFVDIDFTNSRVDDIQTLITNRTKGKGYEIQLAFDEKQHYYRGQKCPY